MNYRNRHWSSSATQRQAFTRVALILRWQQTVALWKMYSQKIIQTVLVVFTSLHVGAGRHLCLCLVELEDE